MIGEDSDLAFGNSFSCTLFGLVYKLCFEHPHHTLPQLLALAQTPKSCDGIERSESVKLIMTKLMKSSISKLIISMQHLLAAYIDLALLSTDAFHKVGRTKNIKFKEIQSRGKRFNECLDFVIDRPSVLTLSPPLSAVNDYENIPRIVNFFPAFSITDNGISRPKIITCTGSDGNQYIELVKGGDDMRQDAVMEQVFDAVNSMFCKDSESLKRMLRIRTYKIVPTTPQTGVLQWVQNTSVFGSIVCDNDSGMHSRYYLNVKNSEADLWEWTHAQCREYMKEANGNEQKIANYSEVVQHFHPSFRFFFFERFADPTVWMACRLAYVRSVAVTSIVGYILGIGDRHAHNILIDTLTGEVIHIDFGIVFEQGKGLGAPETVPFRLTRDIVDGMGISGCDGTFRRSCEEVVRVLRLFKHAPVADFNFCMR